MLLTEQQINRALKGRCVPLTDEELHFSGLSSGLTEEEDPRGEAVQPMNRVQRLQPVFLPHRYCFHCFVYLQYVDKKVKELKIKKHKQKGEKSTEEDNKGDRTCPSSFATSYCTAVHSEAFSGLYIVPYLLKIPPPPEGRDNIR